MGAKSRFFAAAALSFAALGLSACGGSGADNLVGFGSITITSISPSPLLGCAPQGFTITGTGFETLTGTTVAVKFTATGGATPFGGSATTVVEGKVFSDTTIVGTTPAFEICGVAAISVDIDVTLESGVSASASGSSLSVVVSGPTITSISTSSVPAAIPTAFSITGTGFTPGPVRVRFRSDNPAGSGNFDDGTADFAEVEATATSSTNIDGTTPLGRACTANFAANVQLFFDDGCCSLPTAAGFVTFRAPRITGGLVFYAFPETPISSFISGSDFGVTGETGTVRLTATVPIFENGSSLTVEFAGLVIAPSAVTFTIPVVAICGNGPQAVTYHWTAPRGSSCADSAPGLLSIGSPLVTGATPATAPALVPTTITLSTGSGHTIGEVVTLRFASTSAGTPSIFADGTAVSIEVIGTFTAATTITVIAPTATLCGIDTATAQVTVLYPGGACAIGPAASITYEAPALATASPGGIENPNLPVASFPNNNMFSNAGGDPFVLNALPGREFGPVGAVVEVRFTSAGSPLWQGGAQDYDTVLGQVTSATTITGATPGNVSVDTAILPVTVQAFWEDGSCSDTTTAQFVSTSDVAFASGTSIYTIDQAGGGAPALIGAPLADVSTPVIDAHKNRLYALRDTLPNIIEVFETAQTNLGTPVEPVLIGTATGSVSDASDLQLADNEGKLWQSHSTANFILVFQQAATVGTGLSQAFSIDTPSGSIPRRMLYNAPAGEMVVAFSGTDQIGVYDAANGDLNALFLVQPQFGAPWAHVMGLRPGASGAARAYMTYFDTAGGGLEALGTLHFSTGAIASVPWGLAPPGFAGALAFDPLRDRVIHSAPGDFAVFLHDPVTLSATFGFAIPGSACSSISVNPLTDRYFLSIPDSGGVWSFDGAAGTPVGPAVPVPAPGKNACTSP